MSRLRGKSTCSTTPRSSWTRLAVCGSSTPSGRSCCAIGGTCCAIALVCQRVPLSHHRKRAALLQQRWLVPLQALVSPLPPTEPAVAQAVGMRRPQSCRQALLPLLLLLLRPSALPRQQRAHTASRKRQMAQERTPQRTRKRSTLQPQRFSRTTADTARERRWSDVTGQRASSSATGGHTPAGHRAAVRLHSCCCCCCCSLVIAMNSLSLSLSLLSHLSSVPTHPLPSPTV